MTVSEYFTKIDLRSQEYMIKIVPLFYDPNEALEIEEESAEDVWMLSVVEAAAETLGYRVFEQKIGATRISIYVEPNDTLNRNF